MTRPLASSECSGDAVVVGRSEAGHGLHVSAKAAVDRVPRDPGAGGVVLWRARTVSVQLISAASSHFLCTSLIYSITLFLFLKV